MDDKQRMQLADALAPAVREAGAMALELRVAGLRIRHKPDASPVTTADLAVEAIVASALARNCPGIPVVAEESFVESPSQAWPDSYFLVDPIDGTREYIAGRDEFTVNLALIENGFPTLGIVHAPAAGRFLLAARGNGAFDRKKDETSRRLRCGSTRRHDRLIVLGSRSHLDACTRSVFAALPPHVVWQMGSSLKFALIAAGDADLYPRLAPTMGWDSAAGQALVEAAGGVVLDKNGLRLRYDLRTGLRNEGFVAARNADLAAMALSLAGGKAASETAPAPDPALH